MHIRIGMMSMTKKHLLSFSFHPTFIFSGQKTDLHRRNNWKSFFPSGPNLNWNKGFFWTFVFAWILFSAEECMHKKNWKGSFWMKTWWWFHLAQSKINSISFLLFCVLIRLYWNYIKAALCMDDMIIRWWGWWCDTYCHSFNFMKWNRESAKTKPVEICLVWWWAKKIEVKWKGWGKEA